MGERNTSLSFFLAASLLLHYNISLIYAVDSSSTSYPAVFRDHNLDHLNADTLGYYLGINPTTLKPVEGSSYVGYDVAIMFYAQWDRMSHALSPYWAKIGENFNAGSKKSNLVMGLFDCERNSINLNLCKELGINHYPSILFIGSNDNFVDTDPLTSLFRGKEKSAGPAGASNVPRTIKFQGNWQYTDSIRDWILTMQALSAWNSWVDDDGFITTLRKRLFFPFFLGRKNKKSSSDGDGSNLPVGMPSSSAANMQNLENKIKSATEKGELMEKAATHASLLLDNMLFPPVDKDAFANMNKIFDGDAWKKNDNDSSDVRIFRACVIELALDYCSRLSTHVTNDYVNDLLEGNIDTSVTSNVTEMEDDLKQRLSDREEYCTILDDCYAEEFASEECRPNKCPFAAPGCSYLTSCYDPTIQTQYAIGLKIIEEGETYTHPSTTTTDAAATDDDDYLDYYSSYSNNDKPTGGGWLGI